MRFPSSLFNRWPIVAVIVANVALATGPAFVRGAAVPPVAAAFWRLALGLLPLLALAWGTERGRSGGTGLRGHALAVVLAGTLFAADLAAWHLGIVRTKLANATLFGNASALLFPLWGYLVARRWPRAREAAGLLLAGAGGALLLGRSAELSPAHLLGDLLSLAAGLFYTGYLIVLARARADARPLPLIAATTAAGIAPLLALALLLGERVWPAGWGALVALALVSQVTGQGLTIAVLGRLPPLVIGLALLTQPIVSAAIGWSVYGERLGLADLGGAALVAAALAIVSSRRTSQPQAAGERSP